MGRPHLPSHLRVDSPTDGGTLKSRKQGKPPIAGQRKKQNLDIGKEASFSANNNMPVKEVFHERKRLNKIKASDLELLQPRSMISTNMVYEKRCLSARNQLKPMVKKSPIAVARNLKNSSLFEKDPNVDTRKFK